MSHRLALMEGARNCVVGYSGVRPGENVLLWTDRSGEVDPEVVDALAWASQEAGATVSILNEDPPNFRLGEAPSRIATEAMKAANVIMHVFSHANAASVDNIHMLRYMFEYPARVTAVIANTVALMSSPWARFPMPLYWALFRKAAAQVKDAPFTLRDPRGTNLTGRLLAWPDTAMKDALPAGVGAHGSWTFFPSGNIALYPESPLHGVLVAETVEGFGLLPEPVTLRVEDHWVTSIEGTGPAADWLRRMLDRYENAGFVCEVTWGIHPKAGRKLGLQSNHPDTILYRHPGAWHCGLGMWPGSGVRSIFHWDVGGLDATVIIGEETVIDQGRLRVLEDPELREVAAQYGDPDELLAVSI